MTKQNCCISIYCILILLTYLLSYKTADNVIMKTIVNNKKANDTTNQSWDKYLFLAETYR